MSKSMLTKIMTAFILIAIFVPPILLGGVWAYFLVVIVSLLASIEISLLQKHSYQYLYAGLIFVFILLASLLKGQIIFVGLTVFIVVMFLLSFYYEKINIDYIATTFILAAILILAWKGALSIFEGEYGNLAIVYIAFACYFSDAGAYFFGSYFGKHKLNPRLSPNKTIEGAIGGYFTGCVISLIFGVLCTKIPFILLLIGSFTLPAIAEIGDLAFSSIKRHYHIKDFGSFLPGHGGILDRIDSLLFCFMAFYSAYIFWRLFL